MTSCPYSACCVAWAYTLACMYGKTLLASVVDNSWEPTQPFSGCVCRDKYSFHMPYKCYSEEAVTGQRNSDEWFGTWSLCVLTIMGQISCLRLCKYSGGIASAIPGYYCFHLQNI